MHEAILVHDWNWAPFQHMVCTKWAANYKVFGSHRLVPSTTDNHLLRCPLRMLGVTELEQLRDVLVDSEEATDEAIRTNPPFGFLLWCPADHQSS
jgi:hypothetical protein